MRKALLLVSRVPLLGWSCVMFLHPALPHHEPINWWMHKGRGFFSFFDCRWLALPRLWMTIQRRLRFVHWVLVWGSLWCPQSKLTWGAQLKFFAPGWEGWVQGHCPLPVGIRHIHLLVLIHLGVSFYFQEPSRELMCHHCITVSQSCLEHDASIKSSRWPPVALCKLCSRRGPTLKGPSTQSFQRGIWFTSIVSITDVCQIVANPANRSSLTFRSKGRPRRQNDWSDRATQKSCECGGSAW